MSSPRRRTVGAELVDGGVHFRVWAPAHQAVRVVLDGSRGLDLDRDKDGYFSGLAADAHAGTRYRFRLDGERETFPDPASRYQPDGPHGDSVVIDARTFRWTDRTWHGVTLRDAVLYEMHTGTFTREGTWTAARERLPQLKDTGITVIEMMPVAEFPGRFGWGYDGVDLWAPAHIYGTPDDLRSFIDTAHHLGLAVILDVVYNHFGPDGCYMTKFTPDYFTKKYENEWGAAINFDGDHARGVRELFTENAAYWIDEFHFDGLRLDATQSIHDDSPKHVIAEIVERARAAAGERETILVGENEPQDAKLIDEYGLDGLWNDDWHHAAMVAATGRAEAYYTDYRGSPQEFISMARLGFLFQGQRYKWQKNSRGTPSGHLPSERLVCFLQNHDQIANSARGLRLHALTSHGHFRTLTALLLLGPNTPMLFQGEEFASSAPFLYFADHAKELAEQVEKGRGDFLEQFPSLAAMRDEVAAPHDPQTFETCKLDWSEYDTNAPTVRLHRDLLKLRRAMPRDGKVEGAVLGDEALLLRWPDRLLVVNLGRDLHLDIAPEPLLAPPLRGRWQIEWSSEDPRYGGSGVAEVETDDGWKIPGHAAVLFRSAAAKPPF